MCRFFARKNVRDLHNKIINWRYFGEADVVELFIQSPNRTSLNINLQNISSFHYAH